jgi:hypothetical protein
MDIPANLYGGFMFVWLALAIPTIVHLAGRKTDTPSLTIAWGIVAALFPPVGLVFILALLFKDDR